MAREKQEVDWGDRGGERNLRFYGRGLPKDSSSEGKKSRKKGLFKIFRSTPSLTLVLVDILVIILVLSFVIPFIRKESTADDFVGYELSLHGFTFEKKATVSLVVTPVPKPGEEKPVEDAFVNVTFTLPSEEEEKILVRKIEEPLPKIGESTVIRRSISTKNRERPEIVRAEVSIGAESITLQKELLTE